MNEERLTQINIGLSQDTLTKLRELADREERSIAAQIRLIVKLWLEENE